MQMLLMIKVRHDDELFFRAKPTRLGKIADEKVFKDPKTYVKVFI